MIALYARNAHPVSWVSHGGFVVLAVRCATYDEVDRVSDRLFRPPLVRIFDAQTRTNPWFDSDDWSFVGIMFGDAMMLRYTYVSHRADPTHTHALATKEVYGDQAAAALVEAEDILTA